MIDRPAAIISSQWQLIQPIESFLPRNSPIFCSLNKQELIILGGEGSEWLSDGWVFDIRTENMR